MPTVPGIMAYDEAYFDMVRAGIIIYGLYPSEAMDKKALSLCPVMSLRSHITYIKEVPEGTCVSYGGTYVTDKKSKNSDSAGRLRRRLSAQSVRKGPRAYPRSVCAGDRACMYGSDDG